jgi:peptidoglycan/LPS O-acetylase OafA/YrhL
LPATPGLLSSTPPTSIPDTRALAPRLPGLTGLRIFAALAVYASHVGPPHGAPPAVTAFFTSGYMGVTLFFVLSGFVLAINYFEALAHPNWRGVYDYFVARFARVYPLYILIVGYFIVRQHALGQSNEAWWEQVLAVQAWDPDLTHSYNFDPPSWSIGVEFLLYACFPLLVPVLHRVRRPRMTLVVAAGVAGAMLALAAWFTLSGRADLSKLDPGSAHRWLYRMPLTRLGDFTLGILAARLYVQTRASSGLERTGGLLAMGGALAIVLLMGWPALVYSAWSWDVAYALPSVILIFGLAIAPMSWPARGLSLPFVVLLGEASYAFYLVHFPAVDYFGGGRWSVATSATTLIYEAFTLGVIVCLAVGLHTIVERPARTYIRRVLTRTRGR